MLISSPKASYTTQDQNLIILLSRSKFHLQKNPKTNKKIKSQEDTLEEPQTPQVIQGLQLTTSL